MFDDVRDVEQPGRLVVGRDVDDLRVEDLLDLVADHVVDRLRVEFAGDSRLDGVDQRELGVALPRLVHEARVLERDAEAAGERRQESLVGLVERVLAVVVLERDEADRAAGGDEGDEQKRLRHLSGDYEAAVPFGFGEKVLVDQQRLLRVEHVLAEASVQDPWLCG